MILQNWWYTTLLGSSPAFCPPLMKNIRCDILVVGGGIAGLHAALRLAESGKDVVLLEKNICGGSSTGKSAGFLTPDSELELEQLLRRFGPHGATLLWTFASDGIAHITRAIKKYRISCDLQKQDSIFLGIGRSGKNAVTRENATRAHCGLHSELLIGSALKKYCNSDAYTAAVHYDDTYSINPLLYAQGIKRALLSLGVRIFEGSQVEDITGHVAKTHTGSVTANHIIMCIDKIEKTFSLISHKIYHAQTFLSVSEPLERSDIKAIFPTKDVLCWDSKLVYTYYRITRDKRLLVGGGSALTTFTPFYVHSSRVIQHVINDLRKKHPVLNHIEFIQYWPGHIDTTKDLLPIVDTAPYAPHVTFVAGCVGLPWAAASGIQAAERALTSKKNEYTPYLSMNRTFLIPQSVQRVLGKPISFALNNAWSKYFQTDRIKR
ncbi:FAD-binding oxidoreductase [Candidatus Woesearchaeota archaeon]|nr:MAG: FAD-binding oxidoreductase [Candidatus Woesearchaeota archaeon]